MEDKGCIMREPFRVLYGFMMLAVLASACAGIVTAAEIGEWETDNIFVVIGSDYATYYEFDFDASTAHAVHYIYRDIPSVDAFEQVAQFLIDTMLGTNFKEHKITHVDIKGEYGSDTLELHQVVGEDAHLTISPIKDDVRSSELTQILTEWTGDETFTTWGDDYATDFNFDFDTSTVDLYHVIVTDFPSVDAFKRSAQTYINSWLDTTILEYKVTSVVVAGWYGSEYVELRQESGKKAISDSVDPSKWTIQYLGMIDSNVVGKEREKHVNAFIQHNAGIGDVCEITHFYLATCSACMSLELWLNSFKERYPEVVIASYEITEPGVRARFDALTEEYGQAPSHVPNIFVCGSVIEGLEPIEDVFESMALSVYSLPFRPVFHAS